MLYLLPPAYSKQTMRTVRVSCTIVCDAPYFDLEMTEKKIWNERARNSVACALPQVVPANKGRRIRYFQAGTARKNGGPLPLTTHLSTIIKQHIIPVSLW